MARPNRRKTEEPSTTTAEMVTPEAAPSKTTKPSLLKSEVKTGQKGSSGRGISAPRAAAIWEPQVSFPVPPQPLQVSLYGTTVSTDVYRDRIQAKKPSAVIGMADQVNFSTVNGIQFAGDAQETLMSTTIGTWIAQLYSSVARNYQFKTGRTIRDTILTTTGGAGVEGSLSFWIETYSECYLILRGLEGWHAAGAFNETTAAISANISQFVPRLRNDMRRLLEYKVPAAWNNLLDCMCGPTALNANSPVYGIQFGLSVASFDMTVGATITTLLTTAEARLNTLAFPNIVANNDDFNRIANLFSLAYGAQAYPKPKSMTYDATAFWFLYTQLQIVRDTGSNTSFAWPNLNAQSPGTQIVPIMAPKYGAVTDKSYLFTALRPTVISNTPVAGQNGVLTNQIGLVNNLQGLSTNGSHFVYYDETVTSTLVQQSIAAANSAIVGSNNTDLWWFAQAQAEFAIYQRSDPFVEHDSFYMRYTEWIDLTVRQLEDYWLGPVV